MELSAGQHSSMECDQKSHQDLRISLHSHGGRALFTFCGKMEIMFVSVMPPPNRLMLLVAGKVLMQALLGLKHVKNAFIGKRRVTAYLGSGFQSLPQEVSLVELKVRLHPLTVCSLREPHSMPHTVRSRFINFCML